MTLTVREQFLVKLFTARPSNADAIIILCGEDCAPRLDVGEFLFRQGRAPTIVVSGGKDDGGRLTGAERAYGLLMGRGIAHDRIVVENKSENTQEQAFRVAALTFGRAWKRILLIASGYHLPRAYLTFLAEFAHDREPLTIVPVAAGAPWHIAPEGCDKTRSELLELDLEKCSTYSADVASWSQGLKALEGL